MSRKKPRPPRRRSVQAPVESVPDEEFSAPERTDTNTPHGDDEPEGPIEEPLDGRERENRGIE